MSSDTSALSARRGSKGSRGGREASVQIAGAQTWFLIIPSPWPHHSFSFAFPFSSVFIKLPCLLR